MVSPNWLIYQDVIDMIDLDRFNLTLADSKPNKAARVDAYECVVSNVVP